jgi:hypothetical protein
MGKDSKGRKTVTLPPQTPPTSFANLKAAAADAAEAISIAATQLHIFALSSSPQTTTPLRYLTEPATWSALPEELRLRILSFVEVKDLCSLEAVCLETRRLANDDSLWCDLYLRRWRRSRQGDLISVPSDEHLRHFRFDWKDLYKKRFQLELSLWREDHEEHNLHDHHDHEQEQEHEHEHEHEHEQEEDQHSGENDQDSSELRNSGEREGDGEEEKDYEPFPPFKITSDPEECFEWASRLSTRARQIVACRSRRRSYSVDSSSAECVENEYYTACPNLIERRRQHQEEVERERTEEVWSLWFISYEEFVTSQLLRESPRTRVAVNCFLAMLHLYYMSCECCKDVEGVKSSKATDKLFGLLQTRITQ